MKYSHNYPKLFTDKYTTIRRYPKGRIGDIKLETYPAGSHYAKIIDRKRVFLDMLELKVLCADTYNHLNRTEIYALFQSFYKKPINFNSELFYMYYLQKVK